MSLHTESSFSEPELSAVEKFLNKLLPDFLQRRWTSEALLVCDLKDFVPMEPREDVKVVWIKKTEDISKELNQFFVGILGSLWWFVWRNRVRSSKCYIGVAYWENKPASYIMIQLGRENQVRYGKIMCDNSSFVGPAFTASFARGRKIYPYLMSEAFKVSKELGYKYAYGSVSFENDSSIKGIDRFGYYKFAGNFLLHKNFLKYKIQRAKVVIPEAVDLSKTKFSNIHQ